MDHKGMTTRFAEIYGNMPYSVSCAFQAELLKLPQPVRVSAANRWYYSLSTPRTDITIKWVADILRGLGYDVDPETLFKKYPKPVNDAQQEK